MKKLLAFLSVFLFPVACFAAWSLQGTIWYNTTTGSTYYGAYPPGVNTFTPTFTPTSTFTNTPTFTPTATFTPTSTPTNTATATPFAAQSFPNVVFVGKSLGAGTAGPSTVAGGVCTTTITAHGFSSGDIISNNGGTSGGSIGDFNQLHVITGTTTNTYTFATTASTGAITGSPVVLFWFIGNRSLNPTLIKGFGRSAAGSYPVTFVNTQADGFYGFEGVSGAVSNGQYTQINVPTNAGFTVSNELTGSGVDASTYLRIALFGII